MRKAATTPIRTTATTAAIAATASARRRDGLAVLDCGSRQAQQSWSYFRGRKGR